MKALIFDMDGVMIDSEVHWILEEKVCNKKFVPTWNDKDQQRIVGRSPKGVHQLMVDEYGCTASFEEYYAEFNRIAEGIYERKTELMEGFFDFLKNVHGRYPLAVASSADRSNIDFILNRFELMSFFEVVVGATDIVGPSKPAPTIYLHAAKLLGIAPKDCLVIEDAHNGVLAAKAAGMFCVGFRNGINDHQDLSMADKIVRGFPGNHAEFTF